MSSNLKLNNLFPIILFVVLISFCFSFAQSTTDVITPEQNFGFTPGSDRMLFTYEDLIDYLQKLDQVSPKLKMVEIGKSPLGRTMYIAFISSEANINNLDNLKEINRKLALDPDLKTDERDQLIKDGKIFVLATLSMHSGEVGPSQSAPIIAYDLITTTDPIKLQWMENVVYMMVPCHNPDGMNMVVNHYNKYKGTKYEGSSLPGIYHKYVGHDNNRDFVTLSQSDTKAIAKVYSQDWFPQVMVEKHQMGSRGPRYFVPPMHDPIAENVDASVWNWTWIFGSNMVKDMTEKGLAGVSQHYLFDDYWPGSTETCLWKSVIGMLTEGASVKYATPIYVEPNELGAYGKGLSEYKKSINMSMLWEGGWWRLSDLIQYEIESTMSILKTASLQHDEILFFRNEVCRKDVEKGKTQAPYYYILPIKQHDQSELVILINLLREHGVTVFQLNNNVMLDGKMFEKGDFVVPLAHPFRAFIKEVLEKQKFPVRHYTPNGEMIKPYDITSWSLPLHQGVKAVEVSTRSKDLESALVTVESDINFADEKFGEYWAIVFPSSNNESYRVVFELLKNGAKIERTLSENKIDNQVIPAGSFLVKNKVKNGLSVAPIILKEEQDISTEIITLPRVALVETYFHDMDAGWTRYVFDTYQIPYKVLRPGDFEKTDLVKSFDLIVFPNSSKSLLMEGKRKSRDNTYYVSSYPPEFTKGIGKKGMERLMTFLDNGGTIVSWGRSADLFIGPLSITKGKDEKEEFQLPVRNIADQVRKAGFYAPGSLVKILLKENHPLTYGMEKEIGVFYRGNPVFTTSFPNFDMDRRVIAKFPEDNILMSGYVEKEKQIANKTAMVWLKKGKGQLVLFAFNPQFRASTHVSYKLMFNSLLLPKIK